MIRILTGSGEGRLAYESIIRSTISRNAPVAQRIEHLPSKQGVAGSIPAGRAIPFIYLQAPSISASPLMVGLKSSYWTDDISVRFSVLRLQFSSFLNAGFICSSSGCT